MRPILLSCCSVYHNALSFPTVIAYASPSEAGSGNSWILPAVVILPMREAAIVYQRLPSGPAVMLLAPEGGSSFFVGSTYSFQLPVGVMRPILPVAVAHCSVTHAF